MSDDKFSKEEKGIAPYEKGLATGLFVLSTGQTAQPAGGPALANTFAAFNTDKAGFLSKNKINVQQPVAEWKPLIAATAQAMITEATAQANEWIDSVQKQIERAVFMGQIKGITGIPAVRNCFKNLLVKHFKVKTDNDIKEAVAAIHDSLSEVKTSISGINSGSVTYSYGGFFCSGARPGYTGKGSKSNTVLCPYLFMDHAFIEYPGVDTLAYTFIHESLHRIKQWSDKAYADDKTAYQKLSLANALENPDSYAAFAMDAAGCGF